MNPLTPFPARMGMGLTATALATGLLLATVGTPTVAQSGSLPDAGRLLDQTREGNRPLQPPGAPPKVLDAPARPTVTLPEGTTVAVQGFRITGARSYPPEVLDALVQPWVGRSLDLAGLNEAAGALTRHYQAGGHILTYAYLPAQRVASGVIEIAVLEGRVDAVQVVTAQEVRLRDEVVQAHTDPVIQAQPVLQADIERKLLLLNDMPGVVARAAFTPGASTGGADVVVSVAEDEPLATRLEADNHGSRSTGEYRAGAQFQLRNLSGWGDSTQLRALVSNGGGLVSGSINSQLPVGGDGLRLGASLSRLSYALSGDFEDLGAVGVADTFGVNARWPWLRSTDVNLTLSGGLDYQRLNDEVRVVQQSRPRSNRVLQLGLQGDLRDGWLGGGASAGALTLSVGELRAGAAPRLDYKKAQLQLARQQQLFGPLSVYARVLAQYTGSTLDSVDKLALGGANGVRAYAPGEASVDLGRLWSAELRYGFTQLGGAMTVSLFHDRGDGTVNRNGLGNNPEKTANDVRLRGTGFGLQWMGGDYGITASVAWRGAAEPRAEGGDPKPRVYLQLFAAP